MKVMKQSIDFTDKGLCFFQIGLFQENITDTRGVMMIGVLIVYNDDWELNTVSTSTSWRERFLLPLLALSPRTQTLVSISDFLRSR